jgi:hypothetical protein
MIPSFRSFAQPLRRLRLAALAGAAVTLCGSTMAFDPNVTCPTLTNALSQFRVLIDGRFTDGVDEGGHLRGEWSDIVPQAFVVDPSGALFRTCVGDPAAGSIVYTSLAPGEGVSVDALYLMYDFLADTNDPSLFAVGDTLAQVSFGVHLPTSLGGVPNQNTPITVKFIVSNPVIGTSAAVRPAAVIGIGTSIDVVFDVNIPGGQTNVPGFRIGLQGAATFGPSVNSATPHLQAELEVGLRIPPNFGTPGGPIPGNGIDPATGLYDPAPKFWGSSFNDPTGGGGGIGLAAVAAAIPVTTHPASANLVTINPNGSVTVNSGANAGSGFVPLDAASFRKMVLDKFTALRATSTDKRQQHELDEIIQLLLASQNPAFYLDAARLAPRKGVAVFAFDAAVVEEIGELIPADKTSALAVALQACLDKVLGMDGEFVRVAIVDATAANVDPKRIKAAQDELARGDADAAAGRNIRAIVHYASAFSALNGRGRGDHDDDDRGGRH